VRVGVAVAGGTGLGTGLGGTGLGTGLGGTGLGTGLGGTGVGGSGVGGTGTRVAVAVGGTGTRVAVGLAARLKGRGLAVGKVNPRGRGTRRRLRVLPLLLLAVRDSVVAPAGTGSTPLRETGLPCSETWLAFSTRQRT